MRVLRFILNASEVSLAVQEDSTLLAVLREALNLTGAKEGCGEGDCGACTVLLEGKAVNSCIFPAIQAEGKRVLTVEGLAKNGELSALQRLFLEHGAVQCGFCSSGMILSAHALLLENPKPTRAEVKRALSGNLCRCTGYEPILEAVLAASAYYPEEGKR